MKNDSGWSYEEIYRITKDDDAVGWTRSLAATVSRTRMPILKPSRAVLPTKIRSKPVHILRWNKSVIFALPFHDGDESPGSFRMRRVRMRIMFNKQDIKKLYLRFADKTKSARIYWIVPKVRSIFITNSVYQIMKCLNNYTALGWILKKIRKKYPKFINKICFSFSVGQC